MDLLALILLATAPPLLALGVVLGMPVLLVLGAGTLMSGPALFTAVCIRRRAHPQR